MHYSAPEREDKNSPQETVSMVQIITKNHTKEIFNSSLDLAFVYHPINISTPNVGLHFYTNTNTAINLVIIFIAHSSAHHVADLNVCVCHVERVFIIQNKNRNTQFPLNINCNFSGLKCHCPQNTHTCPESCFYAEQLLERAI